MVCDQASNCASLCHILIIYESFIFSNTPHRKKHLGKLQIYCSWENISKITKWLRLNLKTYRIQRRGEHHKAEGYTEYFDPDRN